MSQFPNMTVLRLVHLPWTYARTHPHTRRSVPNIISGRHLGLWFIDYSSNPRLRPLQPQALDPKPHILDPETYKTKQAISPESSTLEWTQKTLINPWPWLKMKRPKAALKNTCRTRPLTRLNGSLLHFRGFWGSRVKVGVLMLRLGFL